MINRTFKIKPAEDINLIREIKKETKILSRANRTGEIENIYSNGLLKVLQDGKNNISNLKQRMSLLTDTSKNVLSNEISNRLFDASLEEYETLKTYLINLIFALDKVQEKEYFSSNLNIDEYNKIETNQLVLSIKKCLVKGFKQTNEFSQSL